ncbi:MAG: toprim domain-containing protein, partial [Candidatus Omnitrophica bacterium]|nr:toprim domain-containing protein [Candidatus Omnitrophota bacterium]
ASKPAPGAEEPPKYVNSPETSLYSKGKNLYGIHLSKDAIRREDRAVIVEGYLDFIMPFQEGAGNVVAGLGTAFTPEQVNLLKRYTHNVVIIYDPDDAGQLASLRALDLFVEEGMNVKVASLPKGQDPDLFVRTQGIDKFKALVSQASSLLDYKLGILKGRYDARQIEGKAAIAAEILPTIKKVKNSITQAEYIRKLAEELDIDEHSVQQELKNTKEEKVFAPRALSAHKPCLMNPTEKLLVKLMLQETSLIEQLRSTLEPADFQDERASRIVSVLFDLVSQGRNIESRSLINQCRDEVLEQLICESALQPEVSPEDKERIVEDCIKRLKSEKVRMKKQYLHEEIKTAQHLGDEKRLTELMQEFHQLTKVR